MLRMIGEGHLAWTRSCLIFLMPGESAGTTQEKTPLAVMRSLVYALFLRLRSVCVSFNPKHFLWKPAYTGQHKNLVLWQCPVVLRKPSSVFVYQHSQQRMQQLGSFSFSGNRDLFSCHLCLFLCPAGSSEPAVLSVSRGPMFGQVVHC